MKRISILLFFISLMMPPCHEPGTSMAQDATECLDTFPQQCGESVQLARLTLPTAGGSVPAAEGLDCTTADDVDVIGRTGLTIASTSSAEYIGVKVTFAVATRITQYVIRLYRSQTSGTIRFSLYTHSSGTDKPDTEVAASVSEEAYTVIGSAGVYTDIVVEPDGGPFEVAAGTYWFVVHGSDASNDLTWQRAALDLSGTLARIAYGSDGINWSAFTDWTYVSTETTLSMMGCQ